DVDPGAHDGAALAGRRRATTNSSSDPESPCAPAHLTGTSAASLADRRSRLAAGRLRPRKVERMGDCAQLEDEPMGIARRRLEVMCAVEAGGVVVDRVHDDETPAGRARGVDDRGERVDEQLAAEPVAVEAFVERE